MLEKKYYFEPKELKPLKGRITLNGKRIPCLFKDAQKRSAQPLACIKEGDLQPVGYSLYITNRPYGPGETVLKSLKPDSKKPGILITRELGIFPPEFTSKMGENRENWHLLLIRGKPYAILRLAETVLDMITLPLTSLEHTVYHGSHQEGQTLVFKGKTLSVNP